MTFFIVLFIVLMQFLWRYIDDLVGKGLSIGVLGELFFYAAVSMVPMALPLAILLASLMTFGNLGERSELTAIKASGISLLKVMSPLIGLVSLIAVGAFFFQNDVLPKAQVKMWTLLFSARQKSPELEIPEGAFYDQIPGYNLYVREKDRNTGMLRDVMIYDVSKGGDNSTILLADSARLAFTKGMRHLYLHLYQGEQFENLREQKRLDRNVPFRRESFLDKEILIPFDANFNRLDEQGMRNQYVGKNMAELRQTIDSLSVRIDSLGSAEAPTFASTVFPTLLPRGVDYGPGYPGGSGIIISANDSPGERTLRAGDDSENADTRAERSGKAEAEAKKAPVKPLDLDSLINALDAGRRDALFTSAASITRMRASELEFRSMQIGDEKKRLRRHEIELLKKFTLSVACLIFLFIGAPLGAIIRKGGLGTPLVISVLLFLVYYVIDNTGYKMAREGYWVTWCGIWLSTFVLLPLGIFVTYKAMNDSAVFNADTYRNWLRNAFGLPESRMVPKKEVIISEVDPQRATALALSLGASAIHWRKGKKRIPGYVDFWMRGWDPMPIHEIGDIADETVEYLSDSRDLHVIDQLNKMPVIKPIWVVYPAHKLWIRKALMWCFPVGILFRLAAAPYLRRIWKDMAKAEEVACQLLKYVNNSTKAEQ